MSKEHFEELFEKFLGESMSPAELARFRELFSDEQYHGIRDRLLETAFSNKAFAEAGEHDPDLVFGELVQKLQAPRRKGILVSFRFRAVAAAVLIFLLAGAGWMIFGTKPAALPGDKATLTLADGHTIVLGNEGNGSLALQGQSEVIKVDSGLLAYHATGKGTGEMVYNMITTPRGGQYQVILPDGTHVWLNSTSSLRFPSSFQGSSRTVTLTGEGYFEVARHPSMPFVVQTDQVAVNVLGTHFNIMAYPQEAAVRTTLEEGSVKVVHGKDGVLITPGQQAELGRNGELKVINDVDLDEALAWKNGKFQFNETDIETIMRQISRWYDVDIAYKGNLSGIRLSGSLSRKEPVAHLLELLEETKRVKFITEGKQITVMTY